MDDELFSKVRGKFKQLMLSLEYGIEKDAVLERFYNVIDQHNRAITNLFAGKYLKDTFKNL